MKTQSHRLRMLLAVGVVVGLVGGPMQGCAPSDAVVEPTSAEPLPADRADILSAEQMEAARTAQADQPVSAPLEETPAHAASPAGSPAESPAPSVMPPAKTVTAIAVQRLDQALVVVVTGDGELSFQAMRLGGNRLVVDLPGVINKTNRKTIVVGHPLVRQIRLGAHQTPQPKLRLVLDLGRAVPHSIEKIGSQLRVTLAAHAPLSATQDVSAPARSVPDDIQQLAERTRRAVAIPAPERLTALDPLPTPVPSKPADSTPKSGEAQAKLGEAKPGGSPESGTAGGSEQFTGARISLDFQDAEVSSVFRLIADVSGLNMVVGESVKAKVTVKLLNVPWDQGLDLILKVNNLGQIREGNVLWIDTLANITKLRDDAARAKESSLKAEELVTKILYLNYSDATKSVDVAKSNLSARGEIKVDARTNSLVVRDVADNLVKVEKIVRDLDQRTPQVQIEARIVQATKTFSRGLGVQWGVSGMQNDPAGTGHSQGPITVNLGRAGGAFSDPLAAASSNFLVNLPSAVAGTGTLGLLIGKFLGTTGTLDLRLSAGESLGLSKIVSSPKIITLDNKQAKIQQGTQIPFATVSQSGTQTTFIDAVLELNVIPHVILHANTVRLEIKASKNAQGAPAPAGPTIDKREATTEVLLRDGETTVLGGIFEEAKTDGTDGIPWFNRIPFLGWLFKRETISTQQTELLIFVTPTILKD